MQHRSSTVYNKGPLWHVRNKFQMPKRSGNQKKRTSRNGSSKTSGIGTRAGRHVQCQIPLLLLQAAAVNPRNFYCIVTNSANAKAPKRGERAQDGGLVCGV
jgi:hypothetical protein